MSFDAEKYFIVFDTNTLYHAYDQKADFSTFYFNRTYDNVVGMINQADIYEYVGLVIPNVVWSEMTKQIVEAHNEKLELIKKQLRKYVFPEFIIEDNEIENYELYIKPIIENYKNQLSSDINKVIELPLASASRFESIVKRAFEKRPPFEGKEKKSDKGFKDALIWESILEFANNHKKSCIIYYTMDNGFNDELKQEFDELYPETNITICKNETEVKEQLEIWSKAIDKYRSQPIMEYREYADLENWIASPNCELQLMDFSIDEIEKSKNIRIKVIHICAYDDIEPQDDEGIKYSFYAKLDAKYETEDKIYLEKTVETRIAVEKIADSDYKVLTVELDQTD